MRVSALFGTLLLAACSGEADFSGMAPQPVTLNAETYRTEILAIDRLVFSGQPVDEARRNELASALESLAGQVRTGSDSRYLKLESLELRALSSRARRLDEDRFRATMTNEWMRIRNNLFDDRAWFARSAADLTPAGAASTANEPAQDRPLSSLESPPNSPSLAVSRSTTSS